MNLNLLENLTHHPDLEVNLSLLSRHLDQKMVFSTSFGKEDQVITHALFIQKIKNIEVFTLDTGRLFPETYAVWDRTLQKYGSPIKVYYPKAAEVEEHVNRNGINSFYTSPELRKSCCAIRKVEPLKRALQGAKIWITGLRAEQSGNRNSMNTIEWDSTHQVYKYNPLLHWSAAEVNTYIQRNNIPYNELHDQGFVSIGCAPCTRAIKDGEDFRAGRWWWEDQGKKECGLHYK